MKIENKTNQLGVIKSKYYNEFDLTKLFNNPHFIKLYNFIENHIYDGVFYTVHDDLNFQGTLYIEYALGGFTYIVNMFITVYHDEVPYFDYMNITPGVNTDSPYNEINSYFEFVGFIRGILKPYLKQI
jgi:hypothetical protein